MGGVNGDGGGGGSGGSVTIDVHGVRAKRDPDGQLAIVDNQNKFIRSVSYHNVTGHRYFVTVDETVQDAEKIYSNVKDEQATDQQITDYLKEVAAGQSYDNLQQNIINSPDMMRVMNAYEQQLYGIDADQNT
ncbi:hypothetical protein [Acetobacter cibinongensis]|uniref:Uncharacterized protein n=1 Tax=Acetobacter cibinongensis TaxID=146475 RepID=A0A1Z5YR30_9PROT|nr:hypothetical protein [Acetobacter cibinongensis]OUI97768.1 hypothetical protein HK14_01880 [Acetobacter cibinongensis]